MFRMKLLSHISSAKKNIVPCMVLPWNDQVKPYVRYLPCDSTQAMEKLKQMLVRAVGKELKNILDKHVFDHEKIYDWAVVRASEPTASIGTAVYWKNCEG